ncbi:diguanylate cyclase [Plantactinospora veratri]|uniref:Diguanylate cyclase n=1 Tax=Plantactinospora veratri TaxID=1436122 RepID=A0ABU7SNJ1_9ACTN
MTTAFLAVVLGPVLLGALSVAGTVATASRQQAEHRLNLAAEAVRTSVGALCRQLHATAGALAVLADPDSRTGAAGEVVTRGLADAVVIIGSADTVEFATPAAPARPWAPCDGPAGTGPAPRALAARVELRDGSGSVTGAVWTAQALDAAFVRRLATASGTAVTLLREAPGPAVTSPGTPPSDHVPNPDPVPGPVPDLGPEPGLAPPVPGPVGGTTPGTASPSAGGVPPGSVSASASSSVSSSAGSSAGTAVPGSGVPDAGPQGAESPSTESTGARAAVLAAARRISGDKVVQANGGRYVRRVGPAPGQPLPLVLSVPRDPPVTRYGPLAIVVLLAAVFAVLAAGRLARSATRPLAELARAADRVAEGDLATRVPVRSPDEVGRLADSFNRMTREAESYLRALVVSRHQLREQLAVLGDTLASSHDLHRIFQLLLRAAMAATGARAGVVLLLDPRTGVLVSQCTEGLDRRGVGLGQPAGADPDRPADDRQRPGDPPALRVPLGKGLLGTVVATGEPRRGRLDRDGPRLYGREPRCRTYVAVPLPSSGTAGQPAYPGAEPGTGTPPLRPATAAGWPGTGAEPGTARPGLAFGVGRIPVGVLALYDRLGADEFDDVDLVTLGTFADHAAVAVENVRMHEEAQRLSLTDPLTGLWNYRYLKESIRREIERASRFGRMLSVLALDLDRFKEVNDTYGHAAGDAVLAEFAQRIRGAMREVDLAFRQGGEEFVVLLPETDARGAATVAERLGAAVRETPMAIRPRSGAVAPVRALVSVTVSIGVAVYPDHATTGPQLLAAADEALYAAKAAGRNTYQMATAGQPTMPGGQPTMPGGQLAMPSGRPTIEEIPVRAGAATPDDGLPWAGGRPMPGAGGGWPTRAGRSGGDGPVTADGGPDGALSGPQPPRQGRGR